MTEKFEDIFPMIRDDETLEFTRAELNGVRVALQWLDENRPLTAKKTMTVQKYEDLTNRISRETETHNLFVLRVLRWLDANPNPTAEPTNAEKWKTFCESLGINLEPWQIDYLSRHMDEAGVTAP